MHGDCSKLWHERRVALVRSGAKSRAGGLKVLDDRTVFQAGICEVVQSAARREVEEHVELWTKARRELAW